MGGWPRASRCMICELFACLPRGAQRQEGAHSWACGVRCSQGATAPSARCMQPARPRAAGCKAARLSRVGLLTVDCPSSFSSGASMDFPQSFMSPTPVGRRWKACCRSTMKDSTGSCWTDARYFSGKYPVESGQLQSGDKTLQAYRISPLEERAVQNILFLAHSLFLL